MLTPALRQLFERARTRLGLEVEVFDSSLASLYPETRGGLGQMIQESQSIRAALIEAMSAGRPNEVQQSGASYTVYPLRHAAPYRQPAGLLAIRRASSSADLRLPVDVEPWSDLAWAVIEAEVTAAASMQEERQRSRRLVATLRFVRYISQTTDESELSRALVQAAAIWFDLDARVYRRDLAGDLLLHTWLPGAEVDDSSRRLDAGLVSSDARRMRLASGSGLVDLGMSGPEALLVPLTPTDAPEWVLALAGQIPAEAEPVIEVVAGVAGAQLEALQAARSQEASRRFETVILRADRAPELVALDVMRELVAETAAASGTLTLEQGDRTRRLVALGTSEPLARMPPEDSNEWVFARDQFVCCIPVGPGIRALVELRPAADADFTPDAVLVTRACMRSLQMWLAGAVNSLHEPATLHIADAAENFGRRIQEEIERALRFDLRLSLVLIDIGAPGTAFDVASVQEALRRELRGSDILGLVNGNQLAALLIQTDASGLSHVVGRLRNRLVDAAGQLNVSRITLGQAAFSPDCRTADALVMQASRQAEPIVMH